MREANEAGARPAKPVLRDEARRYFARSNVTMLRLQALVRPVRHDTPRRQYFAALALDFEVAGLFGAHPIRIPGDVHPSGSIVSCVRVD